MLGLDAAAAAVALLLAMELRFEGAVPPHYRDVLAAALPLSIGLRVLSNFAGQLHRWAFWSAGLHDALRIALSGLIGSLALMVLCPRLAPGPLPRTVYALEFFISTTLFTALRFGPRVALSWWHEQLRRRAGAARTLIVGAGPEAELLARDLRRRADSPYHIVGFTADDPSMLGCRLDGAEVLGLTRDLPSLIGRYGAKMVLLANPQESAARIRELLDLCGNSRTRFKIMPSSSSQLDERLSAAMLADLSPDDLLPRGNVTFDESAIRALVSGRRCLVSGAGGSIGGEICCQLVQRGAKQVIMVDMNENELYLRARRLGEESSGTEIRAEVADIREFARLKRLGERYRPQVVFHAAAHKHVPLMEDAPEEAVKNNVFGTINVARMADGCGAEQFVLISSDKAVNPTSIMGVSKRIAEMSMRHLARSSKTQMTAVRFGNVLGSAGSVVPLFKQQIERGGPVTVTDPECKRYFMTIPEAVGLVLLAGLGGHGEVCVLDMGEQIKIIDLARNLITLSGHVPGEDIPIVFTGLRPGEKLYEELLTEEEEETRAVQNRILVARSPAPPSDLEAMLVELRRFADAGDRDGLLRIFHALVPTFRGAVPAPAPRPAGMRPEPRPAEAAADAGVPAAAVAARQANLSGARS
jgi:FlaA1/EpsC-like NDP-sugar epimerase